MKITIVTNEYSVEGGGLSYSCVQYHLLLKELGHDVSILSSGLYNCDVIHGGYNNRLGKNLAYEAKLKQDLKNIENTQLLIAFGGGFNGYYAALLAGKSNIRFWLMLRGSDGNLAKWDYESCYYLNYSINIAERIICLSEELAENVKLLTRKNIRANVIPNFASRLNVNVKPFSYPRLCIGCGASHMNEKKGLSRLIELVALYNKKYEEKIQLEVVGDVDEDVLSQYQQRIKFLGVDSNIIFLGVKSRNEFRSIQKNWQLYIQTSVCEGMGNSVTDSMSQGIPVMITNTGFVAEFAREQFPQMVFSSFDPEKMAIEIHDMLSDPFATQKYQKVYESFFSEVSKIKVKEIWSKLLNRNIKERLTPELNTIISVSLHDVAGEKHDNITTPVEVFKKFCEDVSIAGYKLCSMKDYMSLSMSERNRYIVCTFDDGYIGLLYNALPIMNKYGYTATVFVCSEYMGKINNWNCKDKAQRMHLSCDDLRTLQNNGWEIGSHGVTHRSLLRLNETEIEKELSESKNILESIFGTIKSYAYPYGDYNNYIMKKVSNYYDYAFLLTQGGVFLSVDSLRIRRYYISEIYKIINNK